MRHGMWVLLAQKLTLQKLLRYSRWTSGNMSSIQTIETCEKGQERSHATDLWSRARRRLAESALRVCATWRSVIACTWSVCSGVAALAIWMQESSVVVTPASHTAVWSFQLGRVRI